MIRVTPHSTLLLLYNALSVSSQTKQVGWCDGRKTSDEKDERGKKWRRPGSTCKRERINLQWTSRWLNGQIRQTDRWNETNDQNSVNVLLQSTIRNIRAVISSATAVCDGNQCFYFAFLGLGFTLLRSESSILGNSRKLSPGLQLWQMK